MEQSGAVAAKKIWSLLRALYFMLRKGPKGKSKNIKLMFDLSMMIKRSKLATGKALDNHHSSNVLPGEYVFSCSNTNTPLYRFNRPRNGSTSGYRFFLCAHALHTKEEDDVLSPNIEGMKALEMHRSPVVRVTDSPYPIREVHDQDESCVDEAAEEFIIKFYQDLKKQNVIISS